MKKILSLFAAVLFAGSMMAADVTVTKSVHDLFPDDANGTQEETLYFDANLSISVNPDGNNGKVYGSGTEWRLYQTNSPIVTVAATNATIKTVAFEFTVKNTGALKFNNAAMTSNVAVTVNAESAQFIVANSGTAANGQVIIKGFTVVYDDGQGGGTGTELTDDQKKLQGYINDLTLIRNFIAKYAGEEVAKNLKIGEYKLDEILGSAQAMVDENNAIGIAFYTSAAETYMSDFISGAFGEAQKAMEASIANLALESDATDCPDCANIISTYKAKVYTIDWSDSKSVAENLDAIEAAGQEIYNGAVAALAAARPVTEVIFTAEDFKGQGISGSGSPVSASKSGVTVSTNLGFGSPNELRVYKNGDFSITSTKYIDKIYFTFSGTSYTGGLDAEIEVNGYSYSISSASSQVRFSEIKVVFGADKTAKEKMQAIYDDLLAVKAYTEAFNQKVPEEIYTPAMEIINAKISGLLVFLAMDDEEKIAENLEAAADAREQAIAAAKSVAVGRAEVDLAVAQVFSNCTSENCDAIVAGAKDELAAIAWNQEKKIDTILESIDAAIAAIIANATKKLQEEVTPKPDPTTCAEAKEYVLNYVDVGELYKDGQVYTLQGYMTGIREEWTSANGYVSFWISDTKDEASQVQVWRAACASAADAPNSGDLVKVTGKLMNYRGDIVEFVQATYEIIERAPVYEYYLVGTFNDWTASAAYKFEGIYSPFSMDVDLEAGAELKVTGVDVNGGEAILFPEGDDNNVKVEAAGNYTVRFDTWPENNITLYKNPTTCAEAAELAQTVSGNRVYYNNGRVYTLQGYVTAIETEWDGSNVTFWIADTRDGGKVLEAYKAVCEAAENVPGVGDLVKVTGYLTKYNEISEFYNNCIYEIVERAPEYAYYLVGSFNNWERSEDYKFELNWMQESAEEYMLGIVLNEGNASMKVQGFDGEQTVWYPDGGDDKNFIINDPGAYTIYFRPNADGDATWHYGMIFAKKLEAPEPAEWDEIVFTEEDVTESGASLDGKIFTAPSNSAFTLTIKDLTPKFAIDASETKFGSEEGYTKYTHRLKTLGSTNSDRVLTLNIPAAGQLRIAPRTGNNSATDRTLVLTQGDKELYNAVVQESDQFTVDGTKMYPYITVEVEQGTVDVATPVSGLNFYSFAFMEAKEPVYPDYYYLKNNWAGAEAWTWKSMLKIDDDESVGVYYQSDELVFGGGGVNLSAYMDDSEETYIKAEEIYALLYKNEEVTDEETTLSALDTVIFLYYADYDWFSAIVTGKYVEPEPAKDVTLYFVNYEGWTAPYAYYWGGTDALTVFPGVEMTKATSVYEWDVYAVTFKEDNNQIIFSDNSANQTSDLGWNAATPYYCNGQWYASLDDIPAPEVPEVHYYLKNNWYGASEWTWAEMEYNTEAEFYMLETVFGGDGINFGTEMNDDQPYFAAEDIIAYTFKDYTVGDRTTLNTFDTVLFTYFAGNTMPTALIKGKYVAPEPVKDVTLYFINSENWDAPFAYYWGGSNSPQWPGVEMTKEGSFDQGDIYAVTFPEDNDQIVFNSGNYQTGDLGWSADKPYYFKGFWYASLDAIPSPADEPDFYIVGNMTDWQNDPIAVKGDSYQFTGLEAYKIYQLKVIHNGQWLGYDNLTDKNGLVGDIDNNICFVLLMTGSPVTVTFKADVFTVTGAAIFPIPAIKDGYYLCGTTFDWFATELMKSGSLDNYKFQENSEHQGEFMLNYTFTEGEQFKVVRIEGNALRKYYPDNEKENYLIDKAHAGAKTIYFNPSGNWEWANYHPDAYIWIEENEPTGLNTVAAGKAVKVLRDGQILILKGDKTFNVIGLRVK